MYFSESHVNSYILGLCFLLGIFIVSPTDSVRRATGDQSSLEDNETVTPEMNMNHFHNFIRDLKHMNYELEEKIHVLHLKMLEIEEKFKECDNNVNQLQSVINTYIHKYESEKLTATSGASTHNTRTVFNVNIILLFIVPMFNNFVFVIN